MSREFAYAFTALPALIMMTAALLYIALWYFKFSFRKKIPVPHEVTYTSMLMVSSITLLLEQAIRSDTSYPYVGVTVSTIQLTVIVFYYTIMALVAIRKHLPER